MSLNILLTNATEFYSGGELFVYELAKELKSRGHFIVVSTRPGHFLQKKCEETEIQTEPIQYGKSIKYFNCIPLLRRVIKKYSIDIVHSNSYFDRTYAGFAALWCKKPHIANIHSQHSIQHNIVHWLRNIFATDYFLVDNNPTRNILINENNIDSKKVLLLPLGIDVSKLFKNEHARQEIRLKYNIPDEVIVVGNVGRLVPFKGHTFLIDAADQIIKQNKNVQFIIIGDGVLENELQQKIEQLGLTSNIHLLGFQDDLPSFYSAMDIYVQPSLDDGGESFPLAVVQALASGLPTIASNVGDIPFMLHEEKNGYLSIPGNAYDLKEKLLRFINNESERIEKGKCAAEYVREHFTISRMTDFIEEIYYRVAKDKK